MTRPFARSAWALLTFVPFSAPRRAYVSSCRSLREAVEIVHYWTVVNGWPPFSPSELALHPPRDPEALVALMDRMENMLRAVALIEAGRPVSALEWLVDA